MNAEDIELEPEEELGDIAAAKVKLKKLRDELEKAKKERAEYLDGWQRCKADSINARKDAEARATRLSEVLREELVHDIIPALDSFEMAAASEEWATIGENWKAGMENVRGLLFDALRRHGITRYGKVGEKYDSEIHEALEELDDAPGEAGTIVRVLRHGYKTADRVLRPAHVFVKKLL